MLCACSGGPDSSALLHVLALLRRRLGHELCAVGVDHGLRVGAAAELEVAASLAHQLDVPFETRRVEVPRRGNLQMQARVERHRALQRAAHERGAAVVALGHTADDRAETVLLRLLRGAGPRGLGAMPPRSPSPVAGEQAAETDLVRPLLAARRSDVLAHLRRHGVAYATDPSNDDRRFLRTRVRHELMPLLEELSPRVGEHLCALADMLRAEPSVGGSAPGWSGSAPAIVLAADSETSVQAGPLIDLLDGLGRRQRQALDRALRLRQGGTCIRVRGGRDLKLEFFRGTPVLRLRK